LITGLVVTTVHRQTLAFAHLI